jgi:hypothetical protein
MLHNACFIYHFNNNVRAAVTSNISEVINIDKYGSIYSCNEYFGRFYDFRFVLQTEKMSRIINYKQTNILNGVVFLYLFKS